MRPREGGPVGSPTPSGRGREEDAPVIFPIAEALFRETRHAANSGAAAHPQLSPAWAHRRGSVKKPAIDRQLGIARRQVARRCRPRCGEGAGGSGSFPASKGSYADLCTVRMLDTIGACDMLENRQKGPEFREVVGLLVRPSKAPRRQLEGNRRVRGGVGELLLPFPHGSIHVHGELEG